MKNLESKEDFVVVEIVPVQKRYEVVIAITSAVSIFGAAAIVDSFLNSSAMSPGVLRGIGCFLTSSILVYAVYTYISKLKRQNVKKRVDVKSDKTVSLDEYRNKKRS